MIAKRTTGRPRGRPPVGRQAMTGAERQAAYKARRYWRLPDGVELAEFEAWLKAKGFARWLAKRAAGTKD